MQRWLFLLSVLTLCFWQIPSSHACQIMTMPHVFDFATAEEGASTILVGTVTNIRYEEDWTVVLEVEVEHYLKGEGFAQAELTVFCASHAELEKRYIFFVNPFSETRYSISHSMGHEGTIPASTENIATVQALTNQSLLPQNLSLPMQLMRFIRNYPQPIAALSLGILGLLAIVYFLRQRPARKTKLKREEIQ